MLYCAFDLSKIGCATFGNDTSNLAEGEMGNLIKYRKLYVQRACARERERTLKNLPVVTFLTACISPFSSPQI